jgi:hypothetical protein
MLALVAGALAVVAIRSGVRLVAVFPVTWEVTKGKVWGIPIGASIDRVADGLRAPNLHRSVFVTLPDPVRVREGDDIGARLSSIVVSWLPVEMAF